MRLDLNEAHLMAAARSGVAIAINTDAHSIDGLQVIRFGITQARRALLKPAQVINTWPLKQLLDSTNR